MLKSWAVPKGPSLDPADKRLAVETEDHPLEYIDFEGVIPEGEYGGGPMIVWDTGIWAPMDDVEKSLRTGAFKFRLAGEKLNGGWMLARLKPRPGEKKTNWLLFKEHDQAADPARDILAERPESVKSGRRIEELVAPPPAPAKPAKRLRPGSLPGAVQGPGPERLQPQLATPVASPPAGDDWLHEIKLDGYRTLACVAAATTVRLITRGGLDWTHRYGDLADAFRALPCREAIVDGEIVVLDDKGDQPLRALAGRAVARGEERARVLRLRPRAARRLEPRRGAARAAQGAAAPAAGRGDRALGDPVQRPCRRRRAGVLRAGLAARARGRGVEARRRRPTSRAGRRPGPRPRRS